MIYRVSDKMEVPMTGAVLFHEHVGCISNDLLHAFGKEWLDLDYLADFAAQVLTLLRERYDLQMFVDGTPIDLGRDVRLLQTVSEKANMSIVASTGLYYFPACVTDNSSPEEIAGWFIKEFREGMEGTGIKPGILKCATDYMGITPDNRKRLAALSITQKETGLPLYAHCRHEGDLAHRQLDVLLEAGAEPEMIAVGHVANCPEPEYLKSLMDRGCYIVMDQCHCSLRKAEVGEALAQLCRMGYVDKILLGNDLCIYSDFPSRDYTGLHLTVEEQADQFSHLFQMVYGDFCRAGGKEQDWEKMISKNALKILNVAISE